MKRPSWEQYALLLAEAAALRSEDPFVQVGACALDHNNRVLGVAYNGLAPGTTMSDYFWADRDGRRPYVLHAETNLLSLFKQGEGKLIACTLLPCSGCARQIVAHGIKKVVYRDTYTKDTGALDIFKFYGIEILQLTYSLSSTSIN
jgi:dCMP deaminase